MLSRSIGLDPARGDCDSFANFFDPDGNSWVHRNGLPQFVTCGSLVMSTMHGAGETPRRSRGGYAFLGPIFALGASSADVVKSMPVKTEAVAEKGRVARTRKCDNAA